MANFIGALPGAISQGLIWGIMAIGLYLTFRILDISDLTVDGSFCTGGVTFVVLFSNGMNIWLALVVACVVGMLTGLVTGLLHTLCGIPAILAGILTQLGLWSVNLAIMSMKANVSINVIQKENLDKLLVSLRFVQDVAKGDRPITQHPIFVVGLFTLAIIAVLYWFFGTELGSSIRATGANQHMARAQGINTNFNVVLGLMISNGLVALSGALLSQFQSYADINMGRGAIVIGLAAIIIGEVVFGKIFINFGLKLFSVSIGAIIYYLVVQAVITLLRIDTNYLKLITAVIVAIFLTVPYLKGKFSHPKITPEMIAEQEAADHA